MLTDDQVAQLVGTIESLKLRVTALESAIVNISGFYIESEDGSRQGQVFYGVPKSKLDPLAMERATA